jgi:hypothetical protein
MKLLRLLQVFIYLFFFAGSKSDGVVVISGSIDYCLWLWVFLWLLKKMVLLYVVAYVAVWYFGICLFLQQLFLGGLLDW